MELSRNKPEVRKVEDDAEKTTMNYLAYKSRRVVDEEEKERQLTSNERHSIAGEVADNIKIKSCLQSELVLTFWGVLESVLGGTQFYNTRIFSSKWALATIHSPGGGVGSIPSAFNGE